MRIIDALHLAGEWIQAHEARRSDFIGAYAGGSAAALGDGDELPAGSDLDVFAVLSDPPPMKPGKFEYSGLLLEISYVAENQIFPAERALSDYHLAHSLHLQRTLADPEGRLGALQRTVAENFARSEWLLRRRDHALSRVQSGLSSSNPAASLPDRTLGWLFPTGICTHAVLVAALQNPTVRLRYLKARQVLADEGFSDVYERLLSLSGFAEIAPSVAHDLLARLEPIYDRAAAAGRTPLPYSSDVSPQCRAVAIDSLRPLIGRGDHREAMFWILTGYARAMKILSLDDPDGYERHLPDFHAALAAVNRETDAQVNAARRAVLDFLPELARVTDVIAARHCASETPCAAAQKLI